MPRPNPGRSLASEANLAKRIAYEREGRGLSYGALASLMTEQGCAMRGSAIYKIEKGDPPRRVTVDEFVALTKVFGLTAEELLTPVELIELSYAKELIDELDRVAEMINEAAIRMFEMFTRYYELSVHNPELHEYVGRHWAAAASGNYDVAAMTADGETATDDTRLHDLVSSLSDEIRALALHFVDKLHELGAENVSEAVKHGRRPLALGRALIKGEVS